MAVLAERRPETVAAWLGVLTAGGAYLPIDPLYAARAGGLAGRATPAPGRCSPGGISPAGCHRCR